MLTVLQEGVFLDLLANCRESVINGPWVENFLRDNHDRYATDPVAYFISPKMWTIFNRIKDHAESL